MPDECDGQHPNLLNS